MPPLINPERYIVFKREDYERSDAKELDDVVVIRLQDRFAYSALTSYAGAAVTSKEILEETGMATPEVVGYLHALADHFTDLAERASRYHPKKFPD